MKTFALLFLLILSMTPVATSRAETAASAPAAASATIGTTPAQDPSPAAQSCLAAASDSTTAGLCLIVGALEAYLVPLAGASALTVALLEAFKKLFSTQGRFHRRAVIRWLSQTDSAVPTGLQEKKLPLLTAMIGDHHYDVQAPMRTVGLPSMGGRPAAHSEAGSRREPTIQLEDKGVTGKLDEGAADTAESPVPPAPAPGSPTTAAPSPAPATPALPAVAYLPSAAYAEFFHLTSGQKLPDLLAPRSDFWHWRGIDRAVFELEIARMMSQIQDACDTVLNNPEAYQHLYSFVTRGCLARDADLWRAFLASSPLQNNQAQSERYARIRLLMRRQLDAFQGVTSNRWDELNQLWAVVVGAGVLLVAQLITLDPHDTNGLGSPFAAAWHGLVYSFSGNHPQWLAVLIRSALGGALAPIAKDILSAISQIGFSKR